MEFADNVSQLARYIHEWAHRKGFYGGYCEPPCDHASGSFASAVMLVVTELAEAVEADRRGEDDHVPEELADAVIRLLDLSASLGIDIGKEIENKMLINELRPNKHGKKY